MKKLFAIVLSLIVIPTFHAHAWIGGPFSNNSHTPTGDDGVYEAVATGLDVTGTYRWGVGNQNQAAEYTNGQVGNTGNVQFGGFAGTTNQHVYFARGVVYFGTCFGTVNSTLNVVSCVGTASLLSSTGNFEGTLGGPGAVQTPANTDFIVVPFDPRRVEDVLVIGVDGDDFDILTLPTAGGSINSRFNGELSSLSRPWSQEFFATGIANIVTPGINDRRVPITVYGSRVSFVRNG